MRYRVFYFCKYAKYIGLLGLPSLFTDNIIIFDLLWLFWLLAFVEIALDFSVFKCSIYQIFGIIKLKHKKFRKDIPSVENYNNNVKYSLPFKGEWVVVNGCFTKQFSHSWDIPTQRYAYDFLILKDGKSYENNPKSVEEYYCYNKSILAPADGVIVEVVNNAEDSFVFGNGRFYNRAKHIAGNYIVIQHDETEYSTLAHLKKDSITVKVGEQVIRGQIIAKCGNSGNSTEPHLHFQLQDGKSFYSSLGLPILFQNIKLWKPFKYNKFDNRLHMSQDDIPQGRVSRGYKVSSNL